MKSLRENINICDINFPKMLHARIVRPPSYHCKLIKINEDFKRLLK